jgi:hypothetical protein
MEENAYVNLGEAPPSHCRFIPFGFGEITVPKVDPWRDLLPGLSASNSP